MSEACRHLEWDSAFFGLRIGRVETEGKDDRAFGSIQDWAHSHRLDCLYHLVEAEDTASIRCLEKHGFSLADIRCSLEHRLTLPEEGALTGTRVTRAEDLPTLKQFASMHHEQTRFFKDTRFPRDRAREMYALWLEKTFSSPGGIVFLAESSGLPTGYIACEMDVNQKKGRISLASVDPSHRGQGVGTSLVRAALRWFRENGAATCEVVTQGANIPALRLYTSNGFYPIRTELWYHKWFTPGTD